MAVATRMKKLGYAVGRILHKDTWLDIKLSSVQNVAEHVGLEP